MQSPLFGKRLRERYYDAVFAFYNKLLYSKLAKYYDSFFNLFSTSEKTKERVIESLSSGSILDVACGTGSVLALASNKGLECYGVDLSQGMLDRAKSKVSNAELKIGNFEDIPYPDAHFDYVVCTNAIGSVRVNPRSVISEMLRVCKYGGEVLIADYSEPPQKTFKNKVLIKFFKLFGDTPYDYLSIFRNFGYEPDVEILGLYDTYQFLRVKKEHR